MAVPGPFTGDTSMSRFSTTGMLLAGRVSGERKMGAWQHAKPDVSEQINEPLEGGERSARSPPGAWTQA